MAGVKPFNTEKGHLEASDEKHHGKKIQFYQAATVSTSLNKWKSVTRQRRFVKPDDTKSTNIEKKGSAIESLLVMDDEGARTRLFGRDLQDGPPANLKELNRRLLQYFVKISTMESDLHSNDLDAEFVMSLLAQGADLNARDRHDQTVLHEVAANWNPAVMDLMVECGGDPNAADYRGWTPLHVAAASDYPEMCRVLVRRGADKEATSSNGQTPLFFAAKTDSARSLRALIKLGCEMSGRDCRGRTPLFAASELDRSEAASILLQHGADAFVQDSTGQIAFVPLVEKMPPLVKEALEPLYETFRIEREQHLDLFRLDPKVVRVPSPDGDPVEGAMTPSMLQEVPYTSAMEAITETTNFQAIKSPVVQELISVQWTSYGRSIAIWQIVVQLITIILWTAFAVIKEWAERYQYVLPDEGYRIAILICAILLTGYSIGDEINEYVRAKSRHQKWQDWKLALIDEDVKHCHIRHSEEKDYWLKEREETKKAQVAYFNDTWNYLDWLCYVILMASLVTHFIDVGYPGGDGNLQVARWHVRIMAFNIVLLWLRLLKYAKPFEFCGPFILMLGMIAGDLLKFFLLYLEFLIPFTCIFWTILGGENNLKEVDVQHSGTLKNYTEHNLTKVTVDNFDTVNNLLFSVFRITLVDNYDYENMIAIDQITAQVLLGVWFAISTILFLNLFIAQLSESFKQVYDNAKAAAIMQKAITLNSYYEAMWVRNKVKFHNFLEKKCNPYVKQYDDDVTDVNQTEELQKATLQIRETVEDIQVKFDHLYDAELCDSDEEEEERATANGQAAGSSRSAAAALLNQEQLESRISSLEAVLKDELSSIKSTLRDLAIIVAGGPGGGGGGSELDGNSSGAASPRLPRQQDPPGESNA